MEKICSPFKEMFNFEYFCENSIMCVNNSCCDYDEVEEQKSRFDSVYMIQSFSKTN